MGCGAGQDRTTLAALAAAVAMSFVLGSIHAFSLFVSPLESGLGASRANVSLIYSLALLSLTASVLLGHRLFHRLSPARLSLLVGIVGALGLVLSMLGETLWVVLLGYSLLFGGANGLGYGFCLQMGARALPARPGFALGLVTAVYALGATCFARLLALLVTDGRAAYGFAALAVGVLGVAVFSALLFAHSRVTAVDGKAENLPEAPRLDRLFWLLWCGYGLAVAAGLMALGHAAGIVEAAGGTAEQVLAGAMLVAVGNAVGGLAVAVTADRLPPRLLLFVLPLCSSAGLIWQASAATPFSSLAGLALIGFAYGAMIAVTPFAVARYYGAASYPAAYGRVFTAWGLAGLAAPYLAGVLFDISGAYGTALVAAALAAVGSAGIVCLLPPPPAGFAR